LAIALTAAAALIVAGRRSRLVGADSWKGSLPVLLPVAAALGWLGPAYGAEGVATTVVSLLAIRAFSRRRQLGHQGAWLGVALATGAVVATVVAVAVGAGAGT
jgi:hypothetical protein